MSNLPADGRDTTMKRTKYRSVSIALLLLAFIHMFILLTRMSSYNKLRQFDEAYFSRDDIDVVARRSSLAAPNAPRRPMIPRRLIFTYKYNLLNPSEDDPPFDANDPLTANVLNTIDRYKQYWREEDKSGEAVVSFLSNTDCIEVINKTEPKLVDYFVNEKRGDLKADICRISELLLHGGYYFDADIRVVEPLNFDALPIQDEEISDPSTQLRYLEQGSQMSMPDEDDVVTFATVINVQGVFFQAFLAAMPHHPTIQRALDYILAYYEGNLEELIPDETLPALARYSETIPSRKKPQRIGLGCYTLAASYLATPMNEWTDFTNKLLRESGQSVLEDRSSGGGDKKKMNYSRFLYEISLTSENVAERELFKDVSLQVNQKSRFGDRDWCNHACFGGNKVYFYSRVVGSRGCPTKKNK